MCSAKELFTSLLLLSLLFCYSVSTDTVTPNQPIKDGEILVSTNKTFALGFFSPPNSSHRFVGIWYYPLPDTERTVVWVANRDNPLNDTSGVLSINGQGNLVLNCKNGSIPFWSTNASVSSMNNSMARLLDSGNLVLNIHGDERREDGAQHPSLRSATPISNYGRQRTRRPSESFLRNCSATKNTFLQDSTSLSTPTEMGIADPTFSSLESSESSTRGKFKNSHTRCDQIRFSRERDGFFVGERNILECVLFSA
ncbi:hypothetical protein CJ030_MR0G019233 [Morella rubra]|uniref:Bulb-type lectin domain-containing protein n=1 Tax=Morella rubra TaxID=262757 RepID=A0A6A1UHA0_9ROSI|nr:hypothetical protein CJ030_MR0G019233 [Morella rubra]